MPRDLVAALVRSSLEGGVLLAILWVVCRSWPGMPAAARRWLWWLGSLRLLLGLVPIPRVVMSLRPAWEGAAAAAVSAASGPVAAVTDRIATPWAMTRDAVVDRGNFLILALLVIWVAGVLVSLAATIWRMRLLELQWRAAAPFTDPRALRWRGEWAFALGSARTPEIRVSADTRVPLAVGLRRPGILLPAGSEHLSDDALRIVLAHELSHLRRRDPLLGCLPALAEILFWFHPLARLSSREYLSAREELCDADALTVTHASPRDYGELLLHFAVGRHSVLPGCASCGTPAGRRLKRRLEMLSKNTPHAWPARLAVTTFAIAFVSIGFAPVRLAFGHDFPGGDHAHHKPTPMSYLLKTAGKDGTRGALDIPVDLTAARELERSDRTTLYLRFGNDRWMIHDDQTIADVRKVLEEEDRFDEQDAVVDQKRDELERNEQQLEARYEQLQNQKETLEQRKSELEDRVEELRGSGKSTESLDAERDKIERQIDALSDPFGQISRARTTLDRSRKEFEAWDKANAAEQESVQRRSMEQIERIGRQAIQRGVAERYPAGKTKSE
jgi:beta-lactamase regulating signal transducer with metallopeptidase domain